MKKAPLILRAVVFSLFLGVILAPGVAYAQPSAPEELPPQTPSALRGQRIYENRCIRCHGLAGAGDGEMADQLSAAVPSFADVNHMREVTPADYFDIITNGNMQALMPSWKEELSAQERWDVLFYAWSLGAPRENIETGEEVYTRECAECHADTGDRVDAIAFSDRATMAALSQADLTAGIREGHADVDWKDSLTDDERWAVADYVRTFTYDTLLEAEAALGDGVIAGQVVNGTEGAQSELGGISVTVFPFVGETNLAPITATTQADGRFRVENLPTDTDRRYGLQAAYKGVDYVHPQLIELDEGASASVTLQVYGTTTDDAAISVGRNHIIVDFADNGLQVAEMYVFRNSGDRAYVGAGETIRFGLPAGAQNLSFDDPRMSQSTELVENQVVDTLPVPPGNRQVLVSYTVPYDGQSVTFQKGITYQTQNLNVLVPDVGVEVEAALLQADEPVSTQASTQFLNYTGQDVPAGEELVLKLSNLPRGNTGAGAGSSVSVPPDRSGTLRWFGVGFVALALTFALAYPALRPRLLAEKLLEDDATGAVLRRQRQMLLEEMAELDDAYDAGEVAENPYTDTRAEIKADLIDIMRQLQKLEEEGA